MAIPAVYVTIEDQSFALPQISAGRSVFMCILADRGPHNRVVELNSVAQARRLFGKPNWERTGQGHYLMEKALEYTQKVYVIRPVLLDSVVETQNAAISNASIKYNDPTGSFQAYGGNKFVFVNAADVHNADMAKRVYCDRIGYEQFDVGDYIVSEDDGEDNAVAGLITSKNQSTTNPDLYYFVLEASYTGTSTVDETDNLLFYGEILPQLTGGYKFFNGLGTVECEDETSYNAISVNDYIFPSSAVNGRVQQAVKVTDKDYVGGTTYTLFLESTFTGITSADFELLSKYVANVNNVNNTVDINHEGPDNIPDAVSALEYFPAVQLISGSTYTFTNDSNIVICTGATPAAQQTAYSAVSVKDWIFPSTDTSKARQVISKIFDNDPESETYGEYHLILDEPFEGPTAEDASVRKFVPVQIISNINIRSEANIDENDSDNIYSFYAVGPGKWYNNIYLIGRRNISLERMYTDEDGNTLFPYLFMDLYVYQENSDGTSTLLEGPWAVSLVKEIPAGNGSTQVITDITNGREMYIETVINENSNFIECKSALGVSNLLDAYATTPETDLDIERKIRLQVQAEFASGTVNGSDTKGYDGFYLDKGEDGLQYNAQGRLNLQEGKIEGTLVQAYNGTLESVDSSIELIVQTIYPRYNFDYVVCGGYSANIQNAARQLADTRNDCMVLADTGYNTSANSDLSSRENSYGWNTYNAMLYSQFRKRFDPNTGTNKFWFSPVFHALESHLFVDNNYWISEPVAGIEKGIISEAITLAYVPNNAKMSDLMENEVNVTISEEDGKYFLTQFTTWKRLSVMKRGHAVKFVHYLKKAIPPLLKDILQRKATPFWINMVDARIKGFMQSFVAEDGKYASISSFTVMSTFDDARSQIDVVLGIRPLRAIETINVRIVVS